MGKATGKKQKKTPTSGKKKMGDDVDLAAAQTGTKQSKVDKKVRFMEKVEASGSNRLAVKDGKSKKRQAKRSKRKAEASRLSMAGLQEVVADLETKINKKKQKKGSVIDWTNWTPPSKLKWRNRLYQQELLTAVNVTNTESYWTNFIGSIEQHINNLVKSATTLNNSIGQSSNAMDTSLE